MDFFPQSSQTVDASINDKMTGTTAAFAVLAVALLAGVANAKPPQKIVGGVTAYPGELPYQVSLRTYGQHFCGGTIVSTRHIITAAHCFVGVDPRSITVVTGTISSYSGGQTHSMGKFVTHPYYDPSADKPTFDIAIITLAADMIFNQYQNKLDLPSAPTPGGVIVTASGWGYTTMARQQTVPSLLKIQLRTISTQECQERFGSWTSVQENQICTFNGRGAGTCKGDSGGPLAHNGLLVGIVSFGAPCALGLPDVFTSVYHHLNWIYQNAN